MRHAVQVEVIKELAAQLDAGVNFDAGGMRLCPASTWTCPQRAQREWQTFFREHPQLVGMTADLPEPGNYITTNDVGVPMLITRDATGRVRAFLNSCRHRGSIVEHAARGTKLRFSCQFHAWTYDLAGALVAVPLQEHVGAIDRSCLGLIELPSVERFGFIWVHPDPKGTIDADALFEGVADDFASWGFERYAFGGDHTVDLPMNWKLGTDTFGETYHFKRLHRDTLANDFHGDVLSYRSYQRNHRMVLCIKNIDQMRSLPESQWHIWGSGFPVYFLFPNIVVNVGYKDVTVVRIYPDPNNPGRSISKFAFYFDREELRNNPARVEETRAGFCRVVEHEDFALAVSTQQALNAGVQSHVLFGRNEAPLHHYHNTFRAALGMEPLPLLQTLSAAAV
jgi:phenylpropionate dioxygenase-like ring-hydroxylating dioxygenase large terminal subunit